MWKMCWGCRRYGEWGVGVSKCVWGVGRGVEMVLGWGWCWERGGGGAGKCGEKYGTIWGSREGWCHDLRPQLSTPATPTLPTSTPPTLTPPTVHFLAAMRIFVFLNCGLNARCVEYLEETKLEFVQT